MISTAEVKRFLTTLRKVEFFFFFLGVEKLFKLHSGSIMNFRYILLEIFLYINNHSAIVYSKNSIFFFFTSLHTSLELSSSN